MPLARFQHRPEREARLIFVGEVFGQQDDALLKAEKQNNPEQKDKKDTENPEKKREKDALHASIDTPEDFQAMLKKMQQSRINTAQTDTQKDAVRIRETNKQIARLDQQEKDQNETANTLMLNPDKPEAPKSARVAGGAAPSSPDARVDAKKMESGRAA